MSEVRVEYYNQSGESLALKNQWWSKSIEREERHKHIFAVVRQILERQSYRSMMNLKLSRLYQNMEIGGLSPGSFSRILNPRDALTNRVTLNVIKSCVDTVTSKIGKVKTRPMFLTNDGNWDQQQRADLLTDYIDGQFDASKCYINGRRAFKDACILGTGIVKLYREDNQIKSERVLVEEILVDEIEGIYGSPRQKHQRKIVFREVLCDLYPEYEEKIMTAPSGLKSEFRYQSTADMIEIVESWHLPSGKDNSTGDGRHSISIENATLIDEPYEKDYFPFAIYRWSKGILGYYGMSLSEELIGIQLEINKILRSIQIAQHLVAVPKVWLHMKDKIATDHINNEIGGKGYYSMNPPVIQTAQAMNPEIYQHLESLYRKAYEITGISSMSARSEKPAGVTAAVALNTLQDIESERFLETQEDFQDMYLDMAKKVIDMTRDIYEDDPSLAVKAPGQEFMKKIKWSQCDMEEDQYVMRCFPTGILPTEPGAKLQRVTELSQAGYIEKEVGIDLLDFPDLKAETSLIAANRRLAKKMVTNMLSSGRYESPEPFFGLEEILKYVQMAYLKARLNNAPDSKLELLRRYMDDCQALLSPASPPMAGPATALDPMAVPATPPQSDLLPIQAPPQGVPV